MPENNRHYLQLKATGLGLNPGDFPLGSLESRAAVRARLQAIGNTRERSVLVVEMIGMPLDLAASQCVRRRHGDGSESVVAILKGRREDIADDDLDAWIDSFPFTPA